VADIPVPGGWRSGLASLSPARRGAAIFIVAGLVFSCTDALTKTLVSDAPVADVVFGRHISYLVAITLIAGRRHPRSLLVSSQKRIQLARGLASFGATAIFFLALSLLPLAEVSALGSTTPLIIVGLAGPLLGERVARTAIIGAIVGFAGVLVLIGIDPAHIDLAMLLPIASATAYALFSLLTRVLRAEPPGTTLFYTGFIGMIAATVLFLVAPRDQTPNAWQWVGIGIVGLAALSGHSLLVRAYHWGRASDLAPLGYLSLVWAFLIGATVFGEPVTLQAVIGAVAISVGGLIALRSGTGDDLDVGVSVDFGDQLDPDAPPAPAAEVGGGA
jgi:drug/metabolite transporter (DMT)-like permease